MKISPAGNNLIKNNLIKNPQLKSSNCSTGFKGSTYQPLTYKQVVPLVAVCVTLPFIDKLLPDKHKQKINEVKSDFKNKIDDYKNKINSAYEKKLENYKNNHTEKEVRRLYNFGLFAMLNTSFLLYFADKIFDGGSDNIKKITKVQKAKEIAKSMAFISSLSGLIVLIHDFNYINIFKNLINKAGKKEKEEPLPIHNDMQTKIASVCNFMY